MNISVYSKTLGAFHESCFSVRNACMYAFRILSREAQINVRKSFPWT